MFFFIMNNINLKRIWKFFILNLMKSHSSFFSNQKLSNKTSNRILKK